MRRPSVDEDGGGAARLQVEQGYYDALLLHLGGHAGWQTRLDRSADSAVTLGVDVLAAWRHALLDGHCATTAAFGEYGAQSFTSDTDLAERDSLLVQAGVALRTDAGCTARLEAGGEFFRAGSTAVQIGLQVGWEF